MEGKMGLFGNSFYHLFPNMLCYGQIFYKGRTMRKAVGFKLYLIIGTAALGLMILGWLVGVSTYGIVSAQSADDNLIHACVSQNGSIKIVGADNSCNTNWTPLSWNIQGLPGPSGPQGEQGLPGVPCSECVSTTSLSDNAVNAAKIKDESGITFISPNQIFFGSGGTTVIENMTSITAKVPEPGFMLVQATGLLLTLEPLSIGIGLDASSYVAPQPINGNLSNDSRFAVSQVIPVNPGTNTFYLNAQAFSGGVFVESFQAIYFPTNYGQ